MGRFGTKLDVERSRRELPLTPFFFDLLRLGETISTTRAAQRFRALREERAVSLRRAPADHAAGLARRTLSSRGTAAGTKG
jgi:ATP-dependent DNA ligase